MHAFITDQTQITYSFQRHKKKSKPFGSESHKTAGISKSIRMHIPELNDDLRVDNIHVYILDDNIKSFEKTLDDI